MFLVLAKEFSSFLNSLIAYVVIGTFLTAIGLLMWVFPDTSVLDYGYADMEALFRSGPYVLIFLIPAVTMRSFAEERKSGTMELLLTKPLNDWDILLGKFFASLLLVAFALLPTLIYYYSLYLLGNPPGNIDTPAIAGSYIGLLLLSAVFCAIGIMSSALTSSQIVAFTIGAFLCFISFVGPESVSLIPALSSGGLAVKQLGIYHHYDAMSKGVIDTRDLTYFMSVTFLVLLFIRVILGSRSW